jgi:septum formation protein
MQSSGYLNWSAYLRKKWYDVEASNSLSNPTMIHAKTSPKILLASASPRRLQILNEHGLEATVVPAHIEEILQENESAEIYVRRLSKEKAQTVLEKTDVDRFDVIVAADTIVVYQHHILEKPSDQDEAYRMLALLSGNTHEVYTGYALIFLPQRRLYVDHVITQITFHELSEQQIHEYIATGAPFDKAGAYGIQQVHKTFVKEIKGSFYNVMGLPIEEILKHL